MNLWSSLTQMILPESARSADRNVLPLTFIKGSHHLSKMICCDSERTNMNQQQLRHQAIQCHVRAQRAVNNDDAEWLRDLAVQLSHMADLQEQRFVFHACGELLAD